MSIGLSDSAVVDELKELFSARHFGDIATILSTHQESEDIQVEFFSFVLAGLESGTTDYYRHHLRQMQDMTKVVYIDPNTQQFMQKCDIVNRITACMQRFLYNEEMQMCCSGLMRFGFDARTSDKALLAPCCKALVACMAQYPNVPALQFRCCRSFESATRVRMYGETSDYLESAIDHSDTVNMVHNAMFLKYSEDDEMDMMAICCKIIGMMGATWHFGHYALQFNPLRQGSVNQAIVVAMGKYWYNSMLSEYACKALLVLIPLNREYFTNTDTTIQVIVNVMQGARQEALESGDSATLLSRLVCDGVGGTIDEICQKSIGRSGVIALALSSLCNLYQHRVFSREYNASMHSLVDLLGTLAVDNVDNQQTILFTNSPGLLLGIIKVRHHNPSSVLETSTMRLLIVLEASEGAMKIDPSRIYNLPSHNARITLVDNINLIDAALHTIDKTNADPDLITHALDMLCRCSEAFVHADRNPRSNAIAMYVVRKIMLPQQGECSDENLTQCTVLLEKLSAHRFFALNADLQAAVQNTNHREIPETSTLARMRNSIRANIITFQ